MSYSEIMFGLVSLAILGGAPFLVGFGRWPAVSRERQVCRGRERPWRKHQIRRVATTAGRLLGAAHPAHFGDWND